MEAYNLNNKQNPLDEILNSPGFVVKLALMIFTFFAVMSSWYTVEPEEEAVVLRFGKFHTIGSPGFHLKLPFGVDTVQKLKTSIVLRESFGFYSESGSTSGANRENVRRSNNLKEESHMLTGDLNVADVRWVVQYKISNPHNFLFNTRDPRKNIRDVSEAVMRRVVGDRTVNDVLTTGKAEINDTAQDLMQAIVDHYQMGVRIERIELQDVDPPESVVPAFNDVNIAKQEREQARNTAEAYRNKILPEATGVAEQKIANAEGYAIATVNRAEGDAEKFSAILTEYNKAPKVTRTRLYLELVEEMLGNIDDLTVIDAEVKGLLPVFNQNVGALNGK